MNATFVADPNIQKVAEAYSMDVVDFARKHFKLTLDYSDQSVGHIETILDTMHKQAQQQKPDEERIFQFGKAFGSYIGEVFRRNHGATWGMVTLNGESFPGLESGKNGGMFWPWGKAINRLKNGFEDNIWHYYQHLVKTYDPDKAAELKWEAPAAPAKKSWWKR